MKNNTDRFVKKAMDTLQNTADPASAVKDAVLKRVLAQGRVETASGRFKSFITVYPWRFALGVAVVQNVVCTLVFGAGYTNLILQFMGR
jgi:hypothetical protein